jgi:hypothetical protein
MPEDPKSSPDDVPDVQPSAEDPAHTGSGAPTNEAHREVGDGTLIGSVPAGLTPKEMEETENLDQLSEGGTS